MIYKHSVNDDRAWLLSICVCQTCCSQRNLKGYRKEEAERKLAGLREISIIGWEKYRHILLDLALHYFLNDYGEPSVQHCQPFLLAISKTSICILHSLARFTKK